MILILTSSAVYLVEILFYFLDSKIQYLLPFLTLLLICRLSKFKLKIEAMTIPSLILLGTGSVGYLGSKSKNSSLGTSVNLLLPAEFQLKTLSLFCISASSLVLGNQIAKIISLRISTSNNETKVAIPRYVGVLCIFPIVFMLLGFEIQEFFYRQNHLLATNIPILARLGSAMALIVVPVLAFWTSAEHGAYKFTGIVLICVYAILFFATSSRALVVIPIAALIVIWPYIHGFVRLISLLSLPFASYLGIGIPLYLRSLNAEGLLPYTKALQGFNLEMISIQEVSQNFLVSFDLNGLGAFSVSRFDLRDLLIELSPLLGKQAGWYEIASNHRFNYATPVPALGESMNYGLGWLILIYISCGIIYGVLHGLVRNSSSQLSKIAEYFVISSASYFAILCLQYNLRSSIRIVYYSLAVICIFYIINLIRHSKMQRDSSLSRTNA